MDILKANSVLTKEQKTEGDRTVVVTARMLTTRMRRNNTNDRIAANPHTTLPPEDTTGSSVSHDQDMGADGVVGSGSPSTEGLSDDGPPRMGGGGDGGIVPENHSDDHGQGSSTS